MKKQISTKKLSPRKENQLRLAIAYLGLSGLNEQATIDQVMIGLVRHGKCREATEILFGDVSASMLSDNEQALNIFHYLSSGKSRELLIEFINGYAWSTERPRKGLPIKTHENEWLVIKEPLATKLQVATY